jgi:RNA polymerase sigma-70 factor, ECF subfamily
METSETTQLLRAWAQGDESARDKLTPRVYHELRRLARRMMQHERLGRTLQATALVHEAYLKLIEVNNVKWEHRAHFFAVSAVVMRNILLEGARKRSAAKRGGGAQHVDLDSVADFGPERDSELIALDQALGQLEKMDPRKARVIELRFFGGLTVEESAAVLNVSEDTVMRDWRLARAWLVKEIRGASGSQ